LFHWVDKLEKISTDHREIEKHLPVIKQKLEKLDREELLKRVVALEFDRFLDDYRYDDDLIAPVSEKEFSFRDSRRGRSGERSSGKYSRLFINLGKKDGFYPEQLIDLINKNTSGKKIPLGQIDLMQNFSFFEVEEAFRDKLIDSLKDVNYMNRKVIVEVAQEKPKDDGERGSYRRDKGFKKSYHDKEFRRDKKKKQRR
jgi:ATP-dependent RNA helicase DeaD